MTKELICDKIAVGHNREVGCDLIHSHQWVLDSPHPAHAYCGGCPVHYQICGNENDYDFDKP